MMEPIFFLLSILIKTPVQKTEKMKWLSKNTKFKRGNIHLVSREIKTRFIQNTKDEPNVLIDDYIKNIKEWETKRWYRNTSHISPKNFKRIKTFGF